MKMKIDTGLALLTILAASACAVGPDYVPPSDPIPEAFKESPGWKEAAPSDAIDRGHWWEIFGDSELNALEEKVDVSNQTLKAAAATFAQSRAVLEEARSNFWPTIGLDAAATRNGQGARTSSTLSTGGTAIAPGVTSGAKGITYNSFDAGASLSWELDLWGRIQRTVESSEASAQASGADLANARLSAQSQLAQNYFGLRITDETQRLLDETVEAYTRSLVITQNRYQAGTAAKSDVAQAQAQLENTRAQAVATGIQRAQFENTIALLVGESASNFRLPVQKFTASVPPVPVGVPSALLERRPDVASAERLMASNNAQIGVAIAAFFPDLSLTGSYDLASTQFRQLFSADSAVWSIGPHLAQTLFDGGLKWYTVVAAREGYNAAVANYRQAVLTALQQVETQLASLRFLEREAQVQAVAVRDAVEAEQLILNQYKAGTQAYTAVITAQATTLSSKQAALTIELDQLNALVGLVQALGGGWNRSELDLTASAEAAPSP